MRLWSLHPRHLDRNGLVALWREALLAQAVLAGRTRGYRAHPQLERFRAQPEPSRCLAAYLAAVHEEARARGYAFDRAKIDGHGAGAEAGAAHASPIEVSDGQLAFERGHLLAKLRRRSPADAERLESAPLEAHPLFRVTAGDVAEWERGVAP